MSRKRHALHASGQWGIPARTPSTKTRTVSQVITVLRRKGFWCHIQPRWIELVLLSRHVCARQVTECRPSSDKVTSPLAEPGPTFW
jgi:hypothetical protein